MDLIANRMINFGGRRIKPGEPFTAGHMHARGLIAAGSAKRDGEAKVVAAIEPVRVAQPEVPFARKYVPADPQRATMLDTRRPATASELVDAPVETIEGEGPEAEEESPRPAARRTYRRRDMKAED